MKETKERLNPVWRTPPILEGSEVGEKRGCEEITISWDRTSPPVVKKGGKAGEIIQEGVSPAPSLDHGEYVRELDNREMQGTFPTVDKKGGAMGEGNKASTSRSSLLRENEEEDPGVSFPHLRKAGPLEKTRR
jgi:hypothetical protein